MEHLEELRKRLIHSVIYLFVGMVDRAGSCACSSTASSRSRSTISHLDLNFTHPTDALNLYLKTALVGGAIIASPFILYQIWLFISPGMYANEKKYVWPFMSATVGLFLCRRVVRLSLRPPENAIKVLVFDFGKGLHPHAHHRGLHRLLPRHHPRPRHLLRTAYPHLLSALFGIVDAKFLLRTLPLRHPRHLHRRRHHLPHAGSLQHVPLRQPHALPLLLRRSRRLVRPPQPPQSQRAATA